jgi:hypothetical protein
VKRGHFPKNHSEISKYIGQFFVKFPDVDAAIESKIEHFVYFL